MRLQCHRAFVDDLTRTQSNLGKDHPELTKACSWDLKCFPKLLKLMKALADNNPSAISLHRISARFPEIKKLVAKCQKLTN